RSPVRPSGSTSTLSSGRPAVLLTGKTRISVSRALTRSPVDGGHVDGGRPDGARRPGGDRASESRSRADGEGDRLGHRGEEVVALVVDDDERGGVLDLDLPDRLHAELGVLDDLDTLDAVLREPGGRAADRAEVEAAVGAAGVGDLLAAVALREHDEGPAGGLELVDVGVHPAGRGRAEGAARHAL